MIPQETVNLILDTARVEDVVGDFVTLKRRGASFVACCPFHNEKTPSFYVTPSKGIFKCFGCGKAGSAVGFVMEHEHMSYSEALKYLARKYNIEVVEKEETPEEIAARQHSESLYIVSEFAQKFFAGQLAGGEGRSVGYNYFKSRALEDSTIEKFGLGWAPSGKTALIDAAVAAGYKLEYLIDAGLAVKREDGSVVDKFRERAMFPVHSVSGRVVAFSGRTLHADNPAKYVNSPETEIYVKSRNLLGIYFAKAEISRLHKCILVEGNVDMVMMHQLGITNVVASCGTALTKEQVRLIKKFTDDATIMYDGDGAGIHAALKGLELFLREGMNVKVVLLPDGDDPDSFCRKHTLQEVQDFISDNEKDFISFKSELLADAAGNDPLRKANLINDIADTIAEIPDAVKRSVYVESCASRFKIDAQLLLDRITRTRRAALEAERKERARLDRYQENGLELPPDIPVSVDLPPVQEQPLEENATLAPSERDLLNFILTHGRDVLEFSSDSPYFVSEEDKTTVADFIRSAIENDFANSIYRDLYNAYFQYYDAGAPQERIVMSLLNSPDRRIARAAADLSTERYQLSVKNFSNALTATSSWLVIYVPKAILLYNIKLLDVQMEALNRSLATLDEEGQQKAMKDLITLQNIQKEIKNQYGKKL